MFVLRHYVVCCLAYIDLLSWIYLSVDCRPHVVDSGAPGRGCACSSMSTWPTCSDYLPRRNDDRHEEGRYDSCDHRYDDRSKSSRAGKFCRHRLDFCTKISTPPIFMFNTIFDMMFFHNVFDMIILQVTFLLNG